MHLIKPPSDLHRKSKMCLNLNAKWINTLHHEEFKSAASKKFYLHQTSIQHVKSFKYLGRILTVEGTDEAAVNFNLCKARGKWEKISQILRSQKFPQHIKGTFYKAIVQSTLLFGAQSWILSPNLLEKVNSFHHTVARILSPSFKQYQGISLAAHPGEPETESWRQQHHF